MKRLRAWAELARLSNLPTTWADVLVGFVGGYVTWAATHHRPRVGMGNAYLLKQVFTMGLGVLAAVSLMYVGGMILNDVADAKVDRHDRPGRPLPSRRVGVTGASVAAAVLLLGGFAIIVGAYANWVMVGFGAALVLAIVGYDFLHHHTWWAVALMGVCRGLVILLAAGMFGVNRMWATELGPLAAIAGLYTVLFTMIARLETESKQDERKWGAVGLVLVVWLALWLIQPKGWGWLWAVIAGSAVAGWLGYAAWLVFDEPPQTQPAVAAWIAGFCLADAFYLTLFGQPVVALAAVVFFGLTVLGQRRISGT